MSELPSPLVYWARELTVPLLMAAGVALFVYDSRQLSTEAILLPAGLILVILAALAWAIGVAIVRRPGANVPAAAPAPQDEDTAVGPILNVKAWLLVVLPASLFFLIDYLGALLVLLAIVFGAQVVLGARSPVRAFLIAVVATVPVYAIFKYLLYARFSAGLMGFG